MLNVLRRSLRTANATIRYPDEPEPAPAAFRGQLMLRVERCTGDGACATVCPSRAIVVTRPETGGWIWELNDARCVFCGLCSEACPSEALFHSNEFELAVRNPNDLITRVRFEPTKQSTTKGASSS